MNPWDLPPQTGVVNGPRNIVNPDPAGPPQVPPQVQSLVYNYGVIQPGSNVYGWVTINRVDIHDDSGEHTPGYDKAYRWGAAPAWGRCIEVRDWNGQGALWGLEIDVLSKGRDSTSGRRGLGVVFGRNMPGDDRPYFDFGVQLLPLGGDPDQARLGVAYGCSVPCDTFSAAPAGSWRTFDRDNNIGLVFDEAHGWLLYGMRSKIGNPPDRNQAALAVQVQTGEIMSFGRPMMGPV